MSHKLTKELKNAEYLITNLLHDMDSLIIEFESRKSEEGNPNANWVKNYISKENLKWIKIFSLDRTRCHSEMIIYKILKNIEN